MAMKILILNILVTLTLARHIVINFETEDVTFNPEYLNNTTISVSSPSDTIRNFNMSLTVLKDIGRGLMIDINVLKLKDNGVYKLMYVEESLDFCYMVENNKYGLGDLFSITGKPLCPIKKGTYVIKNVGLKPLPIPAYVPTGKYIIHIEILLEKITISHIVLYGTVINGD